MTYLSRRIREIRGSLDRIRAAAGLYLTYASQPIRAEPQDPSGGDYEIRSDASSGHSPSSTEIVPNNTTLLVSGEYLTRWGRRKPGIWIGRITKTFRPDSPLIDTYQALHPQELRHDMWLDGRLMNTRFYVPLNPEEIPALEQEYWECYEHPYEVFKAATGRKSE